MAYQDQPQYYPEVPAMGKLLKDPEVHTISGQILERITELQGKLSPVLLNLQVTANVPMEPRQTSSPIIEQLLEIKSRLDILLRDIRI